MDHTELGVDLITASDSAKEEAPTIPVSLSLPVVSKAVVPPAQPKKTTLTPTTSQVTQSRYPYLCLDAFYSLGVFLVGYQSSSCTCRSKPIWAAFPFHRSVIRKWIDINSSNEHQHPICQHAGHGRDQDIQHRNFDEWYHHIPTSTTNESYQDDHPTAGPTTWTYIPEKSKASFILFRLPVTVISF